jgi:outer membrane receptor protein involved in Fe transport
LAATLLLDPALPLLHADEFENLLFMNIPSVVTVSKRAERPEWVPSNVTVVTAEQFQEWGSRDIRDVLNRVAGFRVVPDRDEWVFQSRGMFADSTAAFLLMVDGERINGIDSSAISANELPLLPNIKRIEVIRGPGSVVWGSDALVGVINMITWDADDLKERRHKLALSYGDDKTARASYQLAGRGTDADVLFMDSYLQSQGRRINADTSSTNALRDSNTGLTDPRGRYRTDVNVAKPSYLMQLKSKIGEKYAINGFSAYHTTRDHSYEAKEVAGREVIKTREDNFLAGNWHDKLGEVTLDWKTSFHEHQRDNTPLVATPLAQAFSRRDRAVNTSVDAGRSFGKFLDVAAGVDVRYEEAGNDIVISTIAANKPNVSTPVNIAYKKNNGYGSYLSLTLMPQSRLRFVGAARYDYSTNRGDKSSLNPRLGILWQAGEKTFFKALYNTGFLRPPDSFLRVSVAAGATLRPTDIRQYDLIWMQKLGSATDLTVNGYWQKLRRNIVVTAPTIGGGFANAGSVTSEGVEAELRTQVTQRASLWGNATFSRATGGDFPAVAILSLDRQRVEPDGDLLNFPTLTGNLGGTYRAGRFFVSPAVRYVGSQTVRMNPPVGTLANAVYAKVDPFIYGDVNVGFEPNDSVGVYLYVDNVGNQRRSFPISVFNGTMQQPGRFVEGKVSLKW